MIIGLCNKMVVESLKIKSKSHYFWDDMIYLKDFDVNLIKIVKRESRINVDIYYLGHVVKKYYINSINPLYLIVRRVLGHVEKIAGTNDRYFVVADDNDDNKEVLNVFDKLGKFVANKINEAIKNSDKVLFGLADDKVKKYNKLRFSSDVDLPLGVLIKFHALTIVIKCVIEKGSKYYSEIYSDECLYEADTK